MSGYDRSVVEPVCASLVEVISSEVIRGQTVQVDNFGMFKLRFLNRRTIPKHYISGEEAMSEQHFKISFKEYLPLRQRIVKAYRTFLDLPEPDAKKENPYIFWD